MSEIQRHARRPHCSSILIVFAKAGIAATSSPEKEHRRAVALRWWGRREGPPLGRRRAPPLLTPRFLERCGLASGPWRREDKGLVRSSLQTKGYRFLDSSGSSCRRRNIDMEHGYGITADAGIEPAEIPLHLFAHCPFNNLPWCTLRDYSRNSTLTETIKIPGRDLTNKSAARATIDTKKVLRRSYHLLCILHKYGFTLKGNFTADNFIIDSEQFVRMYGIHLSRFERSDGDNDHEGFIKVILEDVFFREPIPNDIRLWLKLIGRGIAAYEYLICYHISLMEPYQAVDCFISLYNIFQDLELDEPDLYDLVITWLDKYDNWQSWDSECINDLMSAARNYRNPHTHVRVLYHNDLRGVLKLVRDCLEHPARRFRDRFTLIVNDEFPELLTDFQEVMFDVGLLQKLRHDTSML